MSKVHVDTYSNQEIGGEKTFRDRVTFEGPVTLDDITLDGATLTSATITTLDSTTVNATTGNIDDVVATTVAASELSITTFESNSATAKHVFRGFVGGNTGAPISKTVSATLTAAELIAESIRVNQGAAAACELQLPLASAMDTALPLFAANDFFEFSVTNISAVAAETATMTTNTGWTLVGGMGVAANEAITSNAAGRFRARKTGTAAWELCRVS